jgi:hypothetical protein
MKILVAQHHIMLKEETAQTFGLAFNYINVVRGGEYGQQLATH